MRPRQGRTENVRRLCGCWPGAVVPSGLDASMMWVLRLCWLNVVGPQWSHCASFAFRSQSLGYRRAVTIERNNEPRVSDIGNFLFSRASQPWRCLFVDAKASGRMDPQIPSLGRLPLCRQPRPHATGTCDGAIRSDRGTCRVLARGDGVATEMRGYLLSATPMRRLRPLEPFDNRIGTSSHKWTASAPSPMWRAPLHPPFSGTGTCLNPGGSLRRRSNDYQRVGVGPFTTEHIRQLLGGR